MAKDGAGETVNIDRFCNDFVGEESARVAVVVENAEQDNGDTGKLGVGFKAAENFPAVGAIHDDIEGDDAWVEDAGHSQTLFAVSGDGDFDGVFLEEAADEAVDGGIVIDDEESWLSGLGEGRGGMKAARGELFGEAEGESGTGAGFGLDVGVAAEHVG